jgi:hypothetical protein
MLSEGVKYAHDILDTIDAKLIESGSTRLSQLVELANLSSIVGNLLATGVVKASGEVFGRAGAHKYQDLRANRERFPESENVEIKVALETNRPKGHLAKEGYYLTCRYVLTDENGKYTRKERGDVVTIWELRFGYLAEHHFSKSNTEGDSGKTAVPTLEGMNQLRVIYFDRRYCPYAKVDKYEKENGLRGTSGDMLLPSIEE